MIGATRTMLTQYQLLRVSAQDDIYCSTDDALVTKDGGLLVGSQLTILPRMLHT
jgi:hypothetical protein